MTDNSQANPTTEMNSIDQNQMILGRQLEKYRKFLSRNICFFF